MVTQTRFGLFGAARKLRGARYAAGVLGLTAIFAGIAWSRGKDPWMFGTIAFVLGILLFRNQLRPLNWPRLQLTRESLLLLRRRGPALAIPWEAISKVEPQRGVVVLTFATELEIPGEGMVERMGLDTRKLMTTPERLAEALEAARQDRSALPTQAEVGAELS